MAFPNSVFGADVVQDANPAADSIKYRTLLKEIDNGLGARDMEKLKYLCQDLGVAPRKFDHMNRGIYLFTELEKLALITADDISLLVLLMQAINRFDLVKKLKSWSGKEGNLAHRLSAYRRLMLRISDSLSRDEKDQFIFYLRGGDTPLPVAAIEECKTPLQLFVLMEKHTLVGPDDLGYFANIMQSIGNLAIVKEIEKYLANERSSVYNVQQSSSQSFLSHQGGGVPYNVSNMGSNVAPAFGGYTQDPSWGGHGYHGIPQQHQQQHQQHHQHQPYHNYPPQQYHHPQQRSTPSLGQPYPPQLWQHGQQPAMKREPEERTSDETSCLTVGPERPKWYYDAVQKKGLAYADELWGKMVQKVGEGGIRMKMQEMKLSEQRNPGEQAPSTVIKSEDDEREASVTRNLHLGSIEDSTTPLESQQSSTSSDDGHKIIPAQTATVQRNTALVPELHKYRMDRLPRGLCIIFNAENFSRASKLDKREGTEKDVEALLNTFQRNLKFKTLVKNDPTAKEYKDYLRRIADMDHTGFDCFVCVILSHGCKGQVFGSDGGKMAIDALTGLFRGEYVPSLVDKPKLFFIQACQGRDAQVAVDIQQDATASVPNESDTLVSLSTVPGYTSNRSISKGSWFISSLCNVINTHYKKVDLLSMLTKVNFLLSQGVDRENGKQIGNPSHTLRKQIFFNQGLGE